MHYIKHTTPITKWRIMISGLSYSGKTTSLPTFIYGPYDYHDIDQQADAITYANNKSMVIISLPGETGIRSLPQDTPHITSYYPESIEGEDIKTAQWSSDAIATFNSLYAEVEKNKPDILVLDGATSFCDHIFNDITNGEWLAGTDLSINPKTGQPTDKYRAAKFYRYGHRTFGNYVAQWNMSPIPFIIITCWEKWKGDTTDTGRPGSIESTRYLLPDMPGEMATSIIGKFDARISARLEKRCLHTDCNDRKESREHYVWQFLPRDPVIELGIKGLKVSKSMQSCPYIHQNYDVLKGLIEGYT